MSQRKDVMLAKAITRPLLDKMPEKVIVQPKLNGRRFLARPWLDPSGRLICLLYSSQGNAIQSVPHINEAFEMIFAKASDATPPTFDGELYFHGMSLQDISSIVSRDKPTHLLSEAMQAWCFDVIEPVFPNNSQADRLTVLEAFVPSEHQDRTSPVVRLPGETVPREHLDVTLKSYVEWGYEGIIIRDPTAIYEEGKQNCILKVKPRKEEWFLITGAFEAISKESEPKGMLGGFYLETERHTPFKCGAGVLDWTLRRHQWALYLSDPDAVIGLWACIRFPEKSASGIPLQPILMSIDKVKMTRKLVGTILDLL